MNIEWVSKWRVNKNEHRMSKRGEELIQKYIEWVNEWRVYKMNIKWVNEWRDNKKWTSTE